MVSGLCRQWGETLQNIPWVVLKILDNIWNWNEFPNGEIRYPYGGYLYTFTDYGKDGRYISLVKKESLCDV